MLLEPTMIAPVSTILYMCIYIAENIFFALYNMNMKLPEDVFDIIYKYKHQIEMSNVLKGTYST